MDDKTIETGVGPVPGLERFGPVIGDGQTAGWLVTIWEGPDEPPTVTYWGLHSEALAATDYLDACAEGYNAHFYALRKNGLPSIPLYPQGAEA